MFDDVLHTLHADALDCLQANLAVLADHFHGPGTHLRLGDTLAFAPVFGDGLPTVEATADERIAQAQRRLGLAVADRADAVSPADLIAMLRDGKPRYVVADAYLMPWVPYFQRRHMPHSLLVAEQSAGLVVTDAYHNTTAWGEARPGTWRLSPVEFAAAMGAEADTVVRMEPAPLAETGAPAAIPVDADVVERYVAAYRDHDDRRAALSGLALETWLLARERLLYAARSGEARFISGLPLWKRLVEHVYLALRRVELGRAEPPHVLDSLTDLLLSEADASERDGLGERVRDAVLSALSQVLGGHVDAPAEPFADMRGFDSFRLVDLIERVERDLGTEVPAQELVPERLADVESLTALFVRCVSRGLVDA